MKISLTNRNLIAGAVHRTTTQPLNAPIFASHSRHKSRDYMTAAAYKALPQNIQALAASTIQPVQAEMYCHLATGRNFLALRAPSLRGLPPSEIDFVGNARAINTALQQGNVMHVRGVGGLATKHSIYSYDGSHSILLLGITEGKYIAHDPDHTQHPITQQTLEEMANAAKCLPADIRPPPRLMPRTIHVNTLNNLRPEIINDEALPIITGDLHNIT